jgi:hypothetical protein
VLKVRASLVGLAALSVVLAGCDHGSSIEAVNNTDHAMLARISVTSFSDTVERFGYVVIVPAKARLFIVEQPFGGPRVDEVEVLTTDCASVADFQDLGPGASIVIDDGPRAELRYESRTGAVTAERTDACPGALPPLPATPAPSLPSSP